MAKMPPDKSSTAPPRFTRPVDVLYGLSSVVAYVMIVIMKHARQAPLRLGLQMPNPHRLKQVHLV